MKSVISLLSLLAIIVGFSSCKKTINCETPIIKKIYFYTSSTTNKVPDTSYILSKYRKESGFSQLSEAIPETRLIKDGNDKYLELPEYGTETYDYNWVVQLKPSNKTYRIAKIEHESETSKTHHCTNTVTYLVNDSAVTVPGNPYSTTPYYNSNIQILYW